MDQIKWHIQGDDDDDDDEGGEFDNDDDNRFHFLRFLIQIEETVDKEMVSTSSSSLCDCWFGQLVGWLVGPITEPTTTFL